MQVEQSIVVGIDGSEDGERADVDFPAMLAVASHGTVHNSILTGPDITVAVEQPAT